ncbi:SDR family NAD(P)-dependent oxidoreductase [Ruania zhangjianzhongii]|uniref:SDR family NAD(P)-dependent oxidoreductase n=1 Tax=Ruania zhangjianzhongii TaxID=2603206 RepID=UPI0011C837CB|nr:SDR family oxidoreductase [Ruania zhangjianzhongii]
MTSLPSETGSAAAVVVIIGGTTGLGAALAASLTRRGAAVVLTGRGPRKAQEVAQRLPGEETLGLACDIRSPGSAQAVWDAAIERFGRVDHWIVNAGIGLPMHSLDRVDPGELAAVLDTNLTGSLMSAQCALAGMLRQGSGRVWLTEGLGSSRRPAVPGSIAYSASKAGLTRAIELLTAEYRSSPVGIGAIRPAIMATGLTSAGPAAPPGPAGYLSRLITASPEDVAEAFAPQILSASGPFVRVNWAAPAKVAGRIARDLRPGTLFGAQ